MLVSLRAMAETVALILTCLALTACAPPEDPARVQLRVRLTQQAILSADELARVREEVSRAIAGKPVRIKDGAVTKEMDEEQRVTVLGMLSDPIGMFDEGLRKDAGVALRLLNSPGESLDSEIEASRRMWIDAQTFLPRRFAFNYAFAGHGDYSYDLVVDQ